MEDSLSKDFTENERVWAKFGNVFYASVILKVSPEEVVGRNRYLIHYEGFRKQQDEWVPATRLMKRTKETNAYAKKLLSDALKQEKDQKEGQQSSTPLHPILRTSDGIIIVTFTSVSFTCTPYLDALEIEFPTNEPDVFPSAISSSYTLRRLHFHAFSVLFYQKYLSKIPVLSREAIRYCISLISSSHLSLLPANRLPSCPSIHPYR